MPPPDSGTGTLAERFPSRYRTALVLSALFLATVAARAPNLGRPLGRHHEFATACVLRVHRIWHDEGALGHAFLPVMTYGGRANLDINNDARQRDASGRWYYTSVPPLGYVVPYLVMRLAFVGPDVLPLQAFNLALHAVSAWFVYLICRMLVAGRSRRPAGAALVGFVVYLFSPATMWFQSNAYFPNFLAVPLFIAGVHLFLRLVRGDDRAGGKRRALLAGLGAVTFAMVASGWLGVLFACFACIYAWRNRGRNGMTSSLVVVAAAAAAGLAAVALHYSLIDGLGTFVASAAGRAALRSGTLSHSPGGLHYLAPSSWWRVAVNYGAGYLPFLVLAVALGTICVRARVSAGGHDASGAARLDIAALYLLGAPVAAHHLVLFNYTAVHDFAAMKAAPLIAVATALMFGRLHAGGTHRRLLAAAVAAAAVLAVVQYHLINSTRDDRHRTIGSEIARTARDDEVVFLDTRARILPQLVFYAGRNIAPWAGEEYARRLIETNGADGGVVYYLTEDDRRVERVERIEQVTRHRSHGRGQREGPEP